MRIELAKALIERGLINRTTRIYARCPVTGMGHAPTYQVIPLTVEKAVLADDTIRFISSHKSGRRYSVPCEDIDDIDGMSPERLAAAYDIKANGLVRSPGKKRGRKPKALSQSA